MVVSDVEGVESESLGEGRERHLVIKPAQILPSKIGSGKPAEKKIAAKKKAPKAERAKAPASSPEEA